MDSEADLDDYAAGYTGDNIASIWTEVPPGSGNWIPTLTPLPDGPTQRRIDTDQVFTKIDINNTFFNNFEKNLGKLIGLCFQDICGTMAPRTPSKEEYIKLCNYAYEGKDVDF